VKRFAGDIEKGCCKCFRQNQLSPVSKLWPAISLIVSCLISEDL
jgi:hypothetical protein